MSAQKVIEYFDIEGMAADQLREMERSQQVSFADALRGTEYSLEDSWDHLKETCWRAVRVEGETHAVWVIKTFEGQLSDQRLAAREAHIKEVLKKAREEGLFITEQTITERTTQGDTIRRTRSFHISW